MQCHDLVNKDFCQLLQTYISPLLARHELNWSNGQLLPKPNHNPYDSEANPTQNP